MASRVTSALGLVFALWALGEVPAAKQKLTFESLHALNGTETVFAYSRISADGDLLTYTSQPFGTREVSRWRLRLLRLSTGRELFTDTGFDGYFSPDGRRLIYRAVRPGRHSVVIRDIAAERSVEDVAPIPLGDYYSWAKQNGRDMIFTILGNYFFLDESGRGAMPANTMKFCPELGEAERPLLSKDGKLVTAFVNGTVVVRPVDQCTPIVRTGIRGAKADFSYDSRYIAMHAPNRLGSRYDIVVFDITTGDVRNITENLPGSSFYPSWTQDGRLSFRYDGPDYQGFRMANGILSVPPITRALIADADTETTRPVMWQDVFEGSPTPKEPTTLVVVWGTWNVHGAEALAELGRAYGGDKSPSTSLALRTATDSVSSERLVADAVRACACPVERIRLRPSALPLTWMNNQNPALLLFRNGLLVDRRLGVQTASAIQAWVAAAAVRPAD